MKIYTLFVVIALTFSVMSNAQTPVERAKSFAEQGQNKLEQKEFTTARFFFKKAFDTYASLGKYEQAIRNGIKANALYLRENLYKEGFELCRDMDKLIWDGEQAEKKTFYDLRFLTINERLQMFVGLKNVAKAKEQLDRLTETATMARNDSLSESLLYTKANYYYTFGQNAEGDASFNKLIAKYKQNKEYQKVSDSYQKLISIARKANNAPLACRSYESFIVWTDSVKALTAKDEYNVLKREHETILQTLQEKEDTISAKQYIIVGLSVLVVILVVALLAGGAILLRYIALTKKQKKSIVTANEHNELKSRFIQNISMQMEPTLQTLSESAQRMDNGEASVQMQQQVDALKNFTTDIQELSTLENTLAEPYTGFKEVNAYNFCEQMMDKIHPQLHADVQSAVNAPKLQVKVDPEQLERVLTHLLENAARYTESGKITLEFKKRSAHLCQFVITDNGCGIPAEQQESLFKPFSRVKDLTEGDGLGLPICALIAIKMNGSLSLDTSYTKGSRFILELHV